MLKIRDIGRYLLPLLLIALFLVACDSDEPAGAGEGYATLSVQLNIPRVEVELKSVSSNPSDPTLWSSWERAVDGRYLYRVSAFLINGERLVATKDLKLAGEPSETVVEFEGNFTHGSYTLMVVANYSAHSAEDGTNGLRTYEGLADFTATVESLLGRTNIDNFTSLYENSFIKYQLASSDGVCAKVPQVLSLVKEIELHPGVNMVEGELIRTYSRVRIEVENQSDEELKITALSFSNLFTQKRAYLFSGIGYIQDKTTINVASANAITPFTASESAPFVMQGKTKAVLFDAYILESKRDSGEEQYSYSLSLGYGGTASFTLKNTTQINSPSAVAKGHYLLYNTNSGRFLTAGSNSVQTGTLGTLYDGMELPEAYVWYLDNTRTNGNSLDENQFYIGTAKADTEGATYYYMANPSGSSISLGDQKSVYFTFGERAVYEYYQLKYYLALRSSGNNNRYIAVDGTSVDGSRNLSNENNFVLYSVGTSIGSKDNVIPVMTIDPLTGQPVTVEEIDRNDFINAVVLIKYNKNKGHFEFEVKEWEEAGGNVDFN